MSHSALSVHISHNMSHSALSVHISLQFTSSTSFSSYINSNHINFFTSVKFLFLLGAKTFFHFLSSLLLLLLVVVVVVVVVYVALYFCCYCSEPIASADRLLTYRNAVVLTLNIHPSPVSLYGYRLVVGWRPPVKVWRVCSPRFPREPCDSGWVLVFWFFC